MDDGGGWLAISVEFTETLASNLASNKGKPQDTLVGEM